MPSSVSPKGTANAPAPVETRYLNEHQLAPFQARQRAVAPKVAARAV